MITPNSPSIRGSIRRGVSWATEVQGLGSTGPSGMSIERFDMIAELSAIGALLNETVESLLKLTRTIPREIHVGRSNTLIRRRSSFEKLPACSVRPQGSNDIFRDLIILWAIVFQLLEHLLGKPSRFSQPREPLFVGLRVAASRLSRRKSLSKPVVIYGFPYAVDPTKAESFFNCHVVWQARAPSRFAIGH